MMHFMAVHPRARGEHARKELRADSQNGSSPRSRGTSRVSVRLGSPIRFIPALAGNMGESLVGRGNLAVHPRARGEHGLS